ncbi:MAG: hypothetical protein H5U07_05375 [Candidatus Aminicenantes bacterium]|nr:hypothetical protein [Candidatus Aminicenantes bacterium]
MFKFALILVLVFSPLAALSSFLITYTEYKKHFPEDLPRARKLSLNFALTTFFFFAILIFLAVVAIYKFLPK